VAIHLGPSGYDVAGLSTDPTRLSVTVKIDAPCLGSLEGLRVAHLQCHIGTDTLSLTRLGASCVGLDFSPDSIVAARALAAETNAPMTFVESPVYDAWEVMEQGQFDLVYTTCGVINWLPDIGRWATVVAGLLQAMIEAGLTITEVADENILEWEFYEGQPVVSPGQWGLPPDLAMRIPLMLRVQATKN
jgi:SAM-dependent methyltransferase